MDDVPIPDSSSNTGQREPDHEILPPRPELGLPLVETIERGLATSPVAVGDFASSLISSTVRFFSNETEVLRQEKAELHGRLDALRNELGNQRQRNAVLNERLASDRGNRHLRNVGVTVGSAMVCAGAFGDFAAGSGQIAMVVLGVALVLAAWVIPRRNPRATQEGADS